MGPESHQWGWPRRAHCPSPTHLPGDLDALRCHRLQGDIHRRPIRSCGREGLHIITKSPIRRGLCSHAPLQHRAEPASSVLMVSSLLGSLRPILLKEYMRMLYTEAGCRSTMFAWLMVGEMFRVDCLKSQESGRRSKGQSAPTPRASVRSPKLSATLCPPALLLCCSRLGFLQILPL